MAAHDPRDFFSQLPVKITFAGRYFERKTEPFADQ